MKRSSVKKRKYKCNRQKATMSLQRSEHSAYEFSSLEGLTRYHILDISRETAYDDLAQLAAQICETPIALIVLLDHDWQWFESRVGLTVSEMPCAIVFCKNTILQNEPLIVQDASMDKRFANNPLVTGDPKIRFYAGVPLITPDHRRIGVLCVIDQVPRQLGSEQIGALQVLSRQVISQLELRHNLVALQESDRRLAILVDHLPGYVYRSGPAPDYKVEFISKGVFEVTGYHQVEYLVDDSVSCEQNIHPDDRAPVWKQVQQALQRHQPYECEYRIITKMGTERWVWERGRGIYADSGVLLQSERFVTDISDRKASENYSRQAAQRENLIRVVTERIRQSLNLNEILTTTVTEIRQVLQSDRVLIFQLESDGSGHIVQESVDANWQASLGRNLVDLCFHFSYVQKYFEGRVSAVTDIDDGSIHPCYAKFLKQFDVRANLVVPIIQTEKLWGLLIAHQCAQPRQWSEEEIHLLKQLADQVAIAIQQASLYQQVQATLRERIQVQNQLKHDAFHDALTGLPNRNFLMKRLELAIDRANRLETYRFAVLFIDLDRFKVINDSLGHLAGDQLLVAIVQKLQPPLREVDLMARLGGDEFVILLEELKNIQEAVRATEQIFAALQTPLIAEGRKVYVTASIGIVLGTKDYTQASHLLRDADIAMYRAKAMGKARYEVFGAEMHTQALNRLHLENDLRRAIEYQEFVLHYQPIVALATGHLVGFEALIRWQHPTQGLKSPIDFISVAEETGLITLLDYWVLQTACHQLAAWQATFPGLADLKVSVNLSAQDLKRPDLLKEVDRVLAQTCLSGHCLTLEITESMLIEDIDSTISLLGQLKERGIQISIDDFGTGYSSLNYLHRLPVDNLKVDRSFVNQIQSAKQNYQIVETIARLSDQLELDPIAEGIETSYQLERLQYLGYNFGQGYLFSKPLNSETTEALLASKNLTFITSKLWS